MCCLTVRSCSEWVMALVVAVFCFVHRQLINCFMKPVHGGYPGCSFGCRFEHASLWRSVHDVDDYRICTESSLGDCVAFVSL